MRKSIPLNRDWKYQSDFNPDYITNEFDDSKFEIVQLPHTNIELPYNNFSEQLYQFHSCYRKRIVVKSQFKQKRAILHFEGVMVAADVYVNGVFVTSHKGGYTPFYADINDVLKYDEENVISVHVDSTERKDIPPFGYVIDYLTYGGIYREVWLEFVNPIHIENAYVKGKNVLSNQKSLEIDLYLSNISEVKNNIIVSFALMKNGTLIESFEEQLHLPLTHKKQVFSHALIEHVDIWSLDSPSLYQLQMTLADEDTILDQYTVRFGFREAEFKNDGFYLNGHLIKLIGLNHHQSFPYVGYAMPKSAQYKDAEILKELGVHMVRTSHYPQSNHFLDRCDELGLLVFDEIPGWQHIGEEDWKQSLIQQTEEMIRKDWNHPSVVIWGVRIDESIDDDNLYIQTNQVAHQLDSIRQTGGVRNFEQSSFLEDVYTYNDFIHRGNNETLQFPKKIYRKNVPYMVTEHNGHMFPTKKFDHEAKRIEHAFRHLRVLDALGKTPRIAGAIGWCMSDYNTHKEFGSGDRICYHGVLDMFRIPKEAAYVYASQQSDSPVLEVSSAMNLGEREAAELQEVCIFTNCDYVTLSKNDEYVGTYFPDNANYSGVTHPPVIIKDFIGDLLEKHEKFSHKDAEIAKKILQAIVTYGDKSLPLRYKLKMGLLMLKNKLSYSEAVKLYTTYVANWGEASWSYEYTGYLNDKAVLSVKKGPSESAGMVAKADSTTLTDEDTYDVTRIVVKHLDNYGNVLHFANDVIHIETEGAIEVIGPKDLALIGGSTAFWIKSKGENVDALVIIRSQKQVIKLRINVLKIENEEW